MIINTVISGNTTISPVNISVSAESDHFIFAADKPFSLTYNYTDTEATAGVLSVFAGTTYVSSTNVAVGSGNTIDVSSGLTATGYYPIRLLITDYNGNADYTEYQILYDYIQHNDMTIAPSDDTFKITAYSGTDNNIIVLSHAYMAATGIKEVTRIEDNAFYNSDTIISVDLPDTILEIGNLAFADCDNLSSITIRSLVPPTLGTNVFLGSEPLLTVFLPAVSLSAYQTAWPSLTISAL